ncbi:formyltransferase family protein [Pseudoalteromonas peptidolytica]|uniref:Formyl transferase N-terminal domain-containing protein n=1 Tax=Pseudoalteromonas peptidolytica F12-50-A1 TaxID=1315280 RepID=A0A8I0MTD1_9GAMM|nr:formyltransferase family protein [Pseudoalteromonas peptidolytica]MBE0345474.1 hypothetical protein [Pseudoalteromonas peptidolytica F12-50-A1]NLR13420.1 methionyl-tRNA formyltransferase [Pseudoalteromonas peptidolytica]GEK10163.1 hypothetical protein PPE03_24120 [Pseudoalteromonas peptidolytica]
MSVVFITGNHPRHAFIARCLAETGKLKKLIIEQREGHIPEPPADLEPELKDLFRQHFTQRSEVELEFFGPAHWPDIEIITTDVEGLNGAEVQEHIRASNPDLLLTYGCHMLNRSTLACASGEKWNIHGGLSPWYRGAITHFWPSYMLEPQKTGMTVHELTQQLDAGDVVHQCVAPMVRGDGVHHVAARAVHKLGKELPDLLQLLYQQGADKITKVAHTTTGKLWLGSQWRPEHLRVIYQFYENRVVDYYLDGKLGKSEPKLHRQF